MRRKGRGQAVLGRTGTGLADQLMEIGRGDVVLMLSDGQAYPEAEATIAEAHRMKVPVVLITDCADGALGRKATAVLDIPRGVAGGWPCMAPRWLA